MDRTPKETEELVLLQAGMGRRTITLPEGAEHLEVIANWLGVECNHFSHPMPIRCWKAVLRKEWLMQNIKAILARLQAN